MQSLIMELPKPESAIDNHFSQLHLSQTDPSQVPFSSSPPNPNPMKRTFSSTIATTTTTRTTSPSTSPKPKKCTSSDTAAAAPLHLSGFNVIQLPSASGNSGTQLPPLWRSASDPTPFPLSTLINSPTQAIEIARASGQRSVSRSTDGSEVTGFESPGFKSYWGVDAGGRFQGSDVRSSKSRSNGSSERSVEIAGNDSPAAKRLRRMSIRMREMKQWFDEVLSEDDDDDDQGPLYQAANTSAQKGGSWYCHTGGDDATEAGKDHVHEQERVVEDALVSAERDGDSIVVHFKCPCGSGYHILLSGQSCYYKLL